MTASRAAKFTTQQVADLDHDALVAETAEYLATRDMRYYGIEGWDKAETAAMAAEAAAKPIEQIQTICDLYVSTLPLLSNLEIREIALKARRCPPRPREVSA